jgi:hypothetical protein
MGREIRMVPPGWEHPKYTHDNASYRDRVGSYMPMYNQTFNDAAREWKKGLIAWERGERPDYTSEESKSEEFWEYQGNPPERAYYRPYKDEEATWFQVYETVSEGTPVTPPFEKREDLVTYLVECGDFWQQKRWAEGNTFMQPEKPGYSRKAAENFVMGDGYAPSMVVIQDGAGTQIAEGINAAALLGAKH